MKLKQKKRDSNITEREKEIIKLIANGFNDYEIGLFLKLSHQTIRQCVVKILSKTETCNRPQLIYWACQNKLI